MAVESSTVLRVASGHVLPSASPGLPVNRGPFSLPELVAQKMVLGGGTRSCDGLLTSGFAMGTARNDRQIPKLG